MDIRDVRRHFHKPVDFTVLTPYSIALNRATFNLSQSTLKDEVNLHVYSNTNLDLVGHVVRIANQSYAIYRQLGEPFSSNHFIYTLIPTVSIVKLAEVVTVKNAIGSAPPAVSNYVEYPCFLNSYATTEIQRPTQQVTQMYQQEFVLASKSIDLSKTYKLNYMGQAYKIKSKLLDNGIVKIFAVEDV